MKASEDLLQMIENVEFIIKATEHDKEKGINKIAKETLQILRKYNGE